MWYNRGLEAYHNQPEQEAVGRVNARPTDIEVASKPSSNFPEVLGMRRDPSLCSGKARALSLLYLGIIDRTKPPLAIYDRTFL